MGNGDADHAQWGRPQQWDEAKQPRPKYACTAARPCSELAAETAAAMAAASIAFAATGSNDDATYAAELRSNAASLFEFAASNRGLYHLSITDAAKFYKSWGDDDDLGWAAAWLARSTADAGKKASYIAAAESYAAAVGWEGAEQSWDGKTPGLNLLLYKLTGKQQHKTMVEKFLAKWMPGEGNTVAYTPQGLAWYMKWGPLRYAANTALIAVGYADALDSSGSGGAGGGADARAREYTSWARGQIQYMLGHANTLGPNGAGFSYLVGYGDHFPRKVHHQMATCPKAPAACDWNTFNDESKPNAYTLYGALVGGPGKDDSFDDKRSDYIKNEVTLDYNAGFTSVLAALIQFDA